MKVFVGILAILLLAFGASFIYLRGDLRLGKEASNKVISNKESGAGNAGTVAGEQTKVETRMTALEIWQKEAGDLKVGQSLTLTAVVKDESGAYLSAPVETTWKLSETNKATLSAVAGSESKLTGRQSGLVKVSVVYKNLKAEKTLTVESAAASTASTLRPDSGQAGNVGVGTTTPPAPIVPFEIKLFDPSGNRFNVGESRSYTSQVQYTDNSLKTPDLDWAVSPGDLGNLDRAKGSSVTFKALKSGSGTLKTVMGSLSASLYIQVN